MIILSLAAKKPVNGIEIARNVARMSSNLWRPSPGSIYFLLKELEKDGLLSKVTIVKAPPYDYVSTKKGQANLASFSEEVRASLLKQLLYAKLLAELAGSDMARTILELLDSAQLSFSARAGASCRS